jgi:catechol 2,3-dioxygenase-like lactoylglutathione lyase family enzyme
MNSEALAVRSIRAFIPTKDFKTSRRFYERLGFVCEGEFGDGNGGIFSFGSSTFILQSFFVKEHAENFMMQLRVDDIDAWWSHVQAAKLSENFNVAAPKPPTLQPWGIVVCYVVDPTGVLWHIVPAATA